MALHRWRRRRLCSPRVPREVGPLLFGVLLAIVGSGTATGAADAPDGPLRRLDRRVTRWLIESHGGSLEEARTLADRMEQGGRWSDVDYEDASRTQWKPMAHVERLHTMARAVAAAEEKVPSVLRKIEDGLRSWIENTPEANNWWHPAIGVPKHVGPLLVMLDDRLSPDLVRRALTLLPEGFRHQQPGMDMDEILNDSFLVYRGLVEGNRELIEKAIGHMQEELVVTTEIGVQPDYSYHNHGPQLYNGGYGKGSLRDYSMWAHLTRNTPFAFAAEKRRLLVDWVLDGDRWLTRHRYFDYSADGRGIARGGRYKAARGWLPIVKRLRSVAPERSEPLAAYADHIRGGPPSVTGNKSFWRSDFMAHKQEAYYTSVALTSKDVVGTEIGNGENLRGFYTPFGGQFLVRGGDEYANIFPVWDWTRVPGVTAPQTPDPPMPATTQEDWAHVQGETDFVGGASDGRQGLMAFDYAVDRDEAKIAGRKSWFFFDKVFVCLGAGIAAETDAPVYTSVEQCLLDGPVTIHRPEETPTQLQGEKRSFDGSVWVEHDGVGYAIPDQPARATAQAKTQRGRWRDVHLHRSKKSVEKDVFSVWLDHGRRPDSGRYRYFVVPSLDAASPAAFLERPRPIAVVANRPAIQAVHHRGRNLTMAALYEAGSVAAGERRLSVDEPCLLLATPNRVTLANPKGDALTVQVTIAPAETKKRTLTFDLPGGGRGGKSVTRSIE